MVKVTSMRVESINGHKRNVVVQLMADTKDEVIVLGNSGAGVEGLTADDTIVLGSMALCADGNLGMINSSGQWHW